MGSTRKFLSNSPQKVGVNRLANRFIITLFIFVMIILLPVIFSTTNSYALSATFKPDTNSSICSYSNTTSNQPTSDLSLPQLFNAIRGSVLDIDALNYTHDNLYVNGTPGIVPSGGSGTAFIIDTAGHLITNNHVVNGSTDITVTFPDGNKYPASIIGTDPYTDLAVLQVNQSAWEQGEQIKPLPIGDSASLQIGQPIIAVGSPAGAARESFTTGIVSQINATDTDDATGNYLSSNLIQHSALIWHGNSGGPLLNMKGQVVGVNERIALISESPGGGSLVAVPGLGLSIPSNTLTKVLCQILKYGHAKDPWLGLVAQDLNATIAQGMGSAGQSPKGIVVVAVAHGGPADQAGLKGLLDKAQYIILGIDGKQVKQMSDLSNYIGSKSAGDTVVLTVLVKGGNPPIQNINVKLGERPPPSTSSLQFLPNQSIRIKY